MKKKISRSIAAIGMFLLLCIQTVYAQNETEIAEQISQTASALQNSAESKEEYLLRDENYMTAGAAGSDWTALTLALSGKKDAYQDYLNRLQDYVEKQYQENGMLDSVKATEYQRISLVMLALGGNPLHVDAQKEEINLIADGTYDFVGESLNLQGSNGLIYALLALDAGNYEVPEGAKYTREQITEQLLACQCEDGSFALVGDEQGDADITAMAVQALAPYRGQAEVADAVGRAVLWLSEQMTENGMIETGSGESVEATAQTILALCALGMDPASVEEFHKGDNFLLDGLQVFRRDDGWYRHTAEEEEADRIATYQALLALEAVEKLRTDGEWILDFTDYGAPESVEAETFPWEWAAASCAVLVFIAAFLIIVGKRRKGRREKCRKK